VELGFLWFGSCIAAGIFPLLAMSDIHSARNSHQLPKNISMVSLLSKLLDGSTFL
jgi:hypothetical protein